MYFQISSSSNQNPSGYLSTETYFSSRANWNLVSGAHWVVDGLALIDINE